MIYSFFTHVPALKRKAPPSPILPPLPARLVEERRTSRLGVAFLRTGLCIRLQGSEEKRMRRLSGGLSQTVFFPIRRIAAAASAVRCLQHFLAVKPEADTNDYTDGNKGFTSICSLIFFCLIFNKADRTLPRHRPCPSIVSRRLPGRLLSSIFLPAPGYLTHVLVRPQNAKNRPFHVPIPFSEAQCYVFMWCVKGRAF